MKSNFKYVWSNLVFAVGAFVIATLSAKYCFDPSEAIPRGKWIVLFVWLLIITVGLIFFLIEFLLHWQWVTVGEDRISVRCVLFEIHSISYAQVKRCFTCKARMDSFHRWGVYRDCIVIDTIKSRRASTIPDGYCHRKMKYIILPDTLENRAALSARGLQL